MSILKTLSCRCKDLWWFTLVELMIVIAIIWILAVSLFPAMTQYLARARDTNKVNELNQLRTAIEIYHIDKETYLVSWVWWGWGWQWWINYIDGISYTVSLFGELKRMGYISRDIRQKTPTDYSLPPITRNKSPCLVTSASADLYMYYFNNAGGRYSLSAYLENPTDKNIDYIQQSYNGIWGNWTCTRYWRNYAVGR
jgi:type II secretory pathway pseudopilin PulG